MNQLLKILEINHKKLLVDYYTSCNITMDYMELQEINLNPVYMFVYLCIIPFFVYIFRKLTSRRQRIKNIPSGSITDHTILQWEEYQCISGKLIYIKITSTLHVFKYCVLKMACVLTERKDVLSANTMNAYTYCHLYPKFHATATPLSCTVNAAEMLSEIKKYDNHAEIQESFNFMEKWFSKQPTFHLVWCVDKSDPLEPTGRWHVHDASRVSDDIGFPVVDEDINETFFTVSDKQFEKHCNEIMDETNFPFPIAHLTLSYCGILSQKEDEKKWCNQFIYAEFD